MDRPFDFAGGEVLLFDKPLGWTSFDVVNKVRRLIGGVKVGHAGTLDPLATGLLVLCTGPKTKDIQRIQDAPKSYDATLYLGATTASYDAEFPPENRTPADHITHQQLTEVLAAFTGAITQLPPAFSAVKVDGKRAYKLARQGKPVALAPREVTVSRIELQSLSLTEDRALLATLSIDCSKGTYIRSLAHDIGQALGVGAYLAALRRTAIGPYHVSDAYTIEAFQARLKPQAH